MRCFVEKLEAGMVRLDPQEARHATMSRRLTVGDAVALFDGRGHEAAGQIASIGKSAVEVRVESVNHQSRWLPALTIAVAMPKGPRQDWLIEKCAELGVAAIQPIYTERSVAEVSEHRLEKWRRATIEAAKQSEQCWLPELLAPVELHSLIQNISRFDLVLAAMTPREEPPIGIADIMHELKIAHHIVGFIGPEGGWSPAEAQALTAAGARAISLGHNVLRIETAAIALASIVHGLTGRAGFQIE